MSDYPLEKWREVFGNQPYHFWGISDSNTLRITSKCNGLVRKYAWQNAQACGRDDIYRAIINAQERMATILNYYPVSHYVTETIQYNRFMSPGYDMVGYAGSDARWLPIKTKEKKIIAIGSEAFEAVDEVDVVLSDANGDGVLDIFTITCTTTVTDTSEIAVYIPEIERFGDKTKSDKWLIDPVNVTISGGTCTITGNCWQIVRPIHYEGVIPEPTAALNPADTDTYCATLEVWRRYTLRGTTTDTCEAMLIWETRPYPWYAYSSIISSTDPAATAIALARLSARDLENGILGIGEAVYNADTGEWSAMPYGSYIFRPYPPDRIVIRYKAGIPSTNRKFEVAIARLAAAEMARPICACQEANREVFWWQDDMSRTGGNDIQFTITPAEDLLNPFGTRRGHIYAYKECLSNLKLSGFCV